MQERVEGGAPLPGDFRLIVCITPPQMNEFGDLLGTPYAPVSKIEPVKIEFDLPLYPLEVHPKSQKFRSCH